VASASVGEGPVPSLRESGSRRPIRGTRIGIDIGGTFTDVTLVSDTGSILVWKQETTPGRLADAVADGLVNLAQSLGRSLSSLLADVDLIVHGSTVALNTLIQRNGPRLGLLCTHGFRDVLLFRDGFKSDRFNIHQPRPADFVDRSLRIGVVERIGPGGEVLVPLDEGSVQAAIDRLEAESVEAIAVALLWSHANPAHELRVAELVRDRLPDLPVLLSSEVLPETGEWVRTSSVVLSAYVVEQLATYVRQLEAWLRTAGFEGELLIMQMNGGCADLERALAVPVNMIASGPVGAPVAAAHYGAALDAADIVTVDMGGTSFDVCLLKDGQATQSRSITVEHNPIGVPGVDVHSIGAGGGSIAWLDSGGALRVGPHSAGAVPGPAAYGQGGEFPTVTDADIVLGYLAPEAFLGGRRTLRDDLAREAIRQHIGKPLGIDAVRAAAGIVRLVNENMAGAIRVVSIERGIDPRPFLLVAGGGAGPLHAGKVAAELGIRRVLVPRQASAMSAFGMTVTDVRYDYSATLHAHTSELDISAVQQLFRGLEARALADLRRGGFSREAAVLRRQVDARYVGQIHELTISLDEEPDDDWHTAIRNSFDRAHRERYTYDLPENEVECLHWRLSGIGVIERLPTEGLDGFRGSAQARPASTREAFFPVCGGMTETPIFSASALSSGTKLDGPAIVEAETTTIVVYPEQVLRADGHGSFLIEL
jgi:N-methylhydantoinase A